jgi:hypothetical protein
VAGGGDVRGRRAFAEHLLDGISGDKVDHQKDERDDQPDDREGVENALGYGFQFSVLGGRRLVVSGQS